MGAKRSTIVTFVLGLVVGAAAVYALTAGSAAPTIYTVTTAGSTSVYPISQQWASYFHEEYPIIIVNPSSGGSGLGQSQVASMLIDIGASSSYPSADYRTQNPKVRVLPVVADALAIVVNPSVNGTVFKLDVDMAVAIFQRNVTTWEQFESTFGVSVTATGSINVYARSDASGTTATFCKWLESAPTNPNPNANFTWMLGSHESVSWVSGVNAVDGNPGVAAAVKGDPNGIGYVGFAFIEDLTPALLYNHGNGEYVAPSIQNALKALPNTLTNPGQNIMNSPVSGAYPIARLLFYLVHEDNIKWYTLAFLFWCVTRGQQFVRDVGAVPINGTSAAAYTLSVLAGLTPS
ncbi:MAG: PstS family phosphate ABC transporter substrate-binding protein [Candidatus Thorarchaeota archaeon]